MVAFTEPENAVMWCIDAQKALLEVEWPPEILGMSDARREALPDGRVMWNGPRVRMGMHTGMCELEVDPTTKRKDYYGPMVNLAARVSGLAVGGQVCCALLRVPVHGSVGASVTYPVHSPYTSGTHLFPSPSTSAAGGVLR